jgi:hypothetical protein
MLSDLVLGFFLSKLFGKSGDAATQSPSVLLPNGAASHAHAHAHAAHATHARHPAAAQPTFPSAVVPSGPGPDPGMKKAVEVWAVRPDVAASTGNPVLTGLVGQVNDATALHALEAAFPAGWAPVQRVSASEQAMAISLLKTWHNGGVVFAGPQTLTGRRAYRMTQHPGGSSAPAPVPVPTQPGQTVPANFPVPVPGVPAPGPVPVIVPAQPSAVPPFVPGIPAQQVTTVRKGEGLAQLAKRLGQPENATSAKALQAANVPNGPGGHTWHATPLTSKTRGLERADRPGDGLEPGDQLYVPQSWGAVDPSKL